MSPESRKFLSWSAWHGRLAKAETLLALALAIELAVMPSFHSWARLPPWGETLVKMGLIVGLFGPIFSLATRVIDGGLTATRKVGQEVLLMPRILIHIAILASLFTGFYWMMHKTWPIDIQGIPNGLRDHAPW